MTKTLIGNIQGPAGATGPAGSAGATGPQGPSQGVMTAFIAPKVNNLTDGATVPVDASLGNLFEWGLGANGHTLSNPTNPVNGETITIDIVYSGAFTPSFGTAYLFGTDGAPTWTSVSGKLDTVSFRYNASKSGWLCLGWKLGY